MEARLIDRSHNFPPEPIEAEAATQKETIEPEDQKVIDLIENTNAWLKEHPVIETEDVAKKATDALEQLQKVDERYDEEFKKAKAPHEEKLKQIRELWHPRIDRIKLCIEALRPRQRAWIKLAEDRRKAQEAAAKRVAEEAQRLADELAAQAQANVTDLILSKEAAEKAKRAQQAAAEIAARRTRLRGNLGGRTHSLRTVWFADIHEIELTFERYKGHREVKELLHRLALADVRNPRLWPNPEIRYIAGCHTYSEQV